MASNNPTFVPPPAPPPFLIQQKIASQQQQQQFLQQQHHQQQPWQQFPPGYYYQQPYPSPHLHPGPNKPATIAAPPSPLQGPPQRLWTGPAPPQPGMVPGQPNNYYMYGNTAPQGHGVMQQQFPYHHYPNQIQMPPNHPYFAQQQQSMPQHQIIPSAPANVASPNTLNPLKLFMNRSFDTCKDDAEKSLMYTALQKIIVSVSANGKMKEHDWEKEPIPVIFPDRPPPLVQSNNNTLINRDRGVNNRPSWMTAGGNSGLDSSSTSNVTMASVINKSSENFRPYEPVDHEVNRKKSRWDESVSNSQNKVSSNTQAGFKVSQDEDSSDSDDDDDNGMDFVAFGSMKNKNNSEKNKNKKNKNAKGSNKNDNQSKKDKKGSIDEKSAKEKLEDQMAIDKNNSNLQARLQRFQKGGATSNIEYSITSRNSNSSLNEFIDYEATPGKVEGKSKDLYKDYYRLTSAPDPDIVRPESVLKEALLNLKKLWVRREATKSIRRIVRGEVVDQVIDHHFKRSQLKAIRQDLTVQGIKNDLTVNVYETHARLALEQEDIQMDGIGMNEFTMCQTQLKALYQEGFKGREDEFIAYRILYLIYKNEASEKASLGQQNMMELLRSLPSDSLAKPPVIHALSVREAVRTDNYHKFFLLYQNVPNMGIYLLDHLVENFRIKALTMICKSYRPSVDVSYVLKELCLEHGARIENSNDDNKQYIDGISYLTRVGCIIQDFNDPETGEEYKIINTKDSVICKPAPAAKKK